MLKHSEEINNKEQIKYNLYKILRMSVLLNKGVVDDETLTKFKDAAINIDELLNKEYDQKLDTMFYDTDTLEDEARRLKNLVAFINERIEKRNGLLDDFKEVSSQDLTGLEYIDKSGELDLFENRLETIRNYIDNSKLVKVNEEDLIKLKDNLTKEYELKKSYEANNIKLEDNLFDSYVNALYEMDIYKDLEIDNIDSAVDNLEDEIKEAKDQMDTFASAFDNLKSSGINGDLELEYTSYVENSKRNYYYVKEKSILLLLYKLINDKASEYSALYSKREEIFNLLEERLSLRKKLNIKDKDYLGKILDLLNDQKQEVDIEKENVDNINVLTERIKIKENRLDELKRSLQSPEVLALLKEYNLIDTYDHNEVIEEELEEVSNEEEIEKTEEVEEDKSINDLLEDLLPEDEEIEEPKEYEILPNQIMDVSTIPTMNYGLSKLKSISVMKRVGDMLGINAKTESKNIEPVKEEEKKDKIDESFWSPVEIVDMKDDMEEDTPSMEIEEALIPKEPTLEKDLDFKKEETNSLFPKIESNKPKEDIKEDIFVSPKEEDIFETEKINDVFKDEPKPNEAKKEEDKFIWPEDNMEKLNVDGLFPN